jgi:pyruvate carboxylase subunit B
MKMKNPVKFTETVLRDAHQCLIATRLRTEDMLPICSKLDQVGYWALESWGGATFDACLRFLKEDPWDRLRLLRKAMPNSNLMMLLRGQNLLGYRHYADDVVEKFIELAVKNGVDTFRVFDALNDMRNLETSIKTIKKYKKHAQGTIAYTTSPVHNIVSFVDVAVSLANLGSDSIAIKDMAGLLTPSVTKELIPALKKAVSLPIHLHSHATSGLSALCQWEAIKLGCEHIDTAISSFAEGPSHACTESLVTALQNTEYDSGLDLNLLQEIAEYFARIRKKYHRFENENNYSDTRVQIYQVPGGMISNLHQQLREQNSLDKLNDVFTEIPKVRQDLGYPPLVTPTSQIVGTQALLNVISGERYKTITNEVKKYLQGLYGRPPGDINKSVRQKAIGNTEYIDCRPADLLKPELNNIKSEVKNLIQSEEDVLSYALFPEVAKNYFNERQSNNLQPELLEIDNSNYYKYSKQDQSLFNHCETLPRNFNIYLHGETYEIKVRGSGQQSNTERNLYLTIDGYPEEILIQQNKQINADNQPTSKSANKIGDVTAAMPGVIIDIKVNLNQLVKAGDVLLIIEAMKMEAEVQAPISGKINLINIKIGDKVIPNQALIEIASGEL